MSIAEIDGGICVLLLFGVWLFYVLASWLGGWRA